MFWIKVGLGVVWLGGGIAIRVRLLQAPKLTASPRATRLMWGWLIGGFLLLVFLNNVAGALLARRP